MKLSAREIVLSGIFAAVIGVLSQFILPLGPIPLTLQTFAVGFVATVLGKKMGTLAVIIYLVLGCIGLPVFAGGSSGFQALAGPTGGFLVGFVFNALVTGGLLEMTRFTYVWSLLANILGALITLLFGVIWLKISTEMPWNGAFSAGMLPFILPGIIKAIAAAYLGVLLVRRLPHTLVPFKKR